MSESNVSPVEPKPPPQPMSGSIKAALLLTLVGMVVFIVVLLITLDSDIEYKLEQMGTFKESYLASCAVSVIYFVGGRVVASYAKKWRKVAKVPRMNQQCYQVGGGGVGGCYGSKGEGESDELKDSRSLIFQGGLGLEVLFGLEEGVEGQTGGARG
jgi:hypothetical protein